MYNRLVVARTWVYREGLTTKEHGEIQEDNELFYILVYISAFGGKVAAYMTLCFCQNSQNCTLTRTDVNICKLYFIRI